MNQTIYQLITDYPDLKEILADIGFTEIVKPGMLQTVGRFMNLKNGSSMRKIPIEKLKAGLLEKGYELKGETNE